jgi:triphosphatase
MTEADTMPHEIELKLWLPPGGREKIEAFPAFVAAEAEVSEQTTTYFDTPELSLARAGFSLRVRRIGDRWVQTVKAATPGQGPASQRSEWEWPVPSNWPVMQPLQEMPTADVVGPLAARLQAAFATNIRRSSRLLQLEDGAIVEASIDEGVIETESAHSPVRELELELKAGPIAPLYRLAISLHEAAWLRLDPESKASLGYRLWAGLRPKARKAAHVELECGISAAEAFRRIVGSGLGHLIDNVPPALLGDVEGVHQMRIAVRRLRSAMKLFEPELASDCGAHFDCELRDLGHVLGDGRDWDVFIEQTIPAAISAQPCDQDLKALREAASRARDACHARIKDALQSPKFTSLVLELAAWAEEGGLHPDLLGQGLCKKVEKLAPDLLDRVASRARKRGRRITRRSGEELHALRKALKKLRYDTEYLAGLYRRKAAKRYEDRCHELQTVLGAINDARMTPLLAEAVAASGEAELDPALTRLAQWSDAHRTEAASRLKAAWKDFRRARPPWQ